MILSEVSAFSNEDIFFLFSIIFLDLSVIMVGDFRQLPPVGGRALYSNPVSASEIHGKALLEWLRVIDNRM